MGRIRRKAGAAHLERGIHPAPRFAKALRGGESTHA
jgi:hypothetical protein